MSFSVDVKTELCRAPLSRKCCAQAEAYGVLLYCNTFHAAQARIVTENGAFAQRLPLLFKKAFRLTFDSPQRAITPGQTVVLYDGDTVVGGAVIETSMD